jgi:hypothetical protein
MGMKDITIALALIFIFGIAIIGFGISFANHNSTPISISDDGDLSDFDTNQRANQVSYTTTINGSLKAYSDSEVVAGAETLEKGTVFKEKPTSGIDAFKNIMSISFIKIFGGDGDSDGFGIVLTTIITTVLIIGVWASWKLWKGGNPD